MPIGSAASELAETSAAIVYSTVAHAIDEFFRIAPVQARQRVRAKHDLQSFDLCRAPQEFLTQLYAGFVGLHHPLFGLGKERCAGIACFVQDIAFK